jgi:hypothetical protein
MLDRRLVLCALSLSLPAAAQLPVLAPTVSTTIDVDAAFGLLSYAAIAIPAGVTVNFTGHYPVRIDVQGNVRVDGALSVMPPPTATGVAMGPGDVTTGSGFPGFYTYVPGYWLLQFPGQIWVPGYYTGLPGAAGRHASVYGAALPFDLAGGSPGGSAYHEGYVGMYEQRLPYTSMGGGGGGTLVIEAAGRIEVFGTVTADGGIGGNDTGRGSGGSILLRGLLGCSIAAGGRVTAMPEGIVRLDAYDLAPQVAGTVQPQPRIVRYPDLAETLPPVLGRTWQLRVAAPRGDVVFLAASCQPGSGSNQYGTYGIDLGSAITFAVVTVPATGHDPLGTFELSLPNSPQFAGLPLWVQGLDWLTSLPPRYTQTVATMVQ